jgi:hypothetical protein
MEAPLQQASLAVDLVEAHRRVPAVVRCDLGAVLKTALDEALGGVRLRPWRLLTLDGTTAVVLAYTRTGELPEPVAPVTLLGMRPVRAGRVLCGLICPMENTTAGGERPVWCSRPAMSPAEAVAAWTRQRAAVLEVKIAEVEVTMKGRHRTVRKAQGAWKEFARLPMVEVRLAVDAASDPMPLLEHGLGRQKAYGFGCLVAGP